MKAVFVQNEKQDSLLYGLYVGSEHFDCMLNIKQLDVYYSLCFIHEYLIRIMLYSWLTVLMLVIDHI